MYRNFKIPAQLHANYARLLDNVKHQSKYLVFVGDFKNNGSEQSTSQADNIFKDGNFGRCEIVGFTAEATGSVKGTPVIKQPSSSKRGAKTRYYLFSTLPGGNSDQLRCAIGLDF